METLTTNTLTFSDMVKLEPHLAALKDKTFVIWLAMRFSRTELQRRWYLEVKPQMCKLVGFSAAIPELKNGEAYDYCYQHLYSVLVTGKAAS
jgi:hypothetical protein